MITANNLEKSFGAIRAVNNISFSIRDNQIFGLVGTNGAGKSTTLRMLAGVLKPDSGAAQIGGNTIYDNPAVKKMMFFIPDEPYFFPNRGASYMKMYYRTIYPAFDEHRFDTLLKDFGLDPNRSISTFSKGMKKQLAIICGLSSGARYLICDETFDGLDPVVRQTVKSIFADDMLSYGLTPVIASHNLRELEDICDHVGLLHRGGLLLDEDLEDLKVDVQKVQFVLADVPASSEDTRRLAAAGANAHAAQMPGDAAAGAQDRAAQNAAGDSAGAQDRAAQNAADGVSGARGRTAQNTDDAARAAAALDGLRVMSHETHGRLHTVVVRGKREEVLAHFRGVGTVYFELLPLSLEEIFISETEVAGYDIRKLILG